MSRINTNVPSLIAQRVLGQNTFALGTALERLSTGLRINRGKDDPAGLIASQNLRAEKAALQQAINNAERADQVVNIAEGGLEEIASLLNELQALVTETANSAGLSVEERLASQLQIDSVLQTIDRVAAATSFQGLKLLNGNLDYSIESVSANVESFRVNGAKLNYGETLSVDVLVVASAQVGGFFLSFGANNLNLGGPSDSDGASESFVLEIAGPNGSRELSFASGTQLSDVAAAINSFVAVTGVRATVSGTTGIRLESTGFGSDQFVSVKIVDDGAIGTASNIGIYNLQAQDANAADTSSSVDFADATNRITDSGQDISATINGITATTRGTLARISTDFLDIEVDLAYDTASANANAARLGTVNALTITGGGADFQLASRVDIAGRVSLGIQNVAVRDVGRTIVDVSGTPSTFLLKDLGTGRELNVVDGNLDAAQKVIETTIREISSLRGRLGAFQKNTIGATIRSLGISFENTTAAESVIRDTDFADETAQLTRAQILVASTTNVLAISNTQPQSVLQLLG